MLQTGIATIINVTRYELRQRSHGGLSSSSECLALQRPTAEQKAPSASRLVPLSFFPSDRSLDVPLWAVQQDIGAGLSTLTFQVLSFSSLTRGNVPQLGDVSPLFFSFFLPLSSLCLSAVPDFVLETRTGSWTLLPRC